ncbi:MAG: PspC domain-containing protein [Chloroflexota bacterium]
MFEGNATHQRLYRSRRERMVAGVAGGVAQYFGIDPVLVRLGFVLGTLWGGIGLPLYIIMAIVVPERPRGEQEADIVTSVSTERAREVAGLVLAGLGAIMLIGNLGWGNAFWGVFNGHNLWPLVLIGLGVALLARQRN